MPQFAYSYRATPSPPARTRVGATVEPVLIRTPDEAEAVWPVADAILPTRTIERLSPKEQQFLLTAFSHNPTLAYRCLRWARWMTSDRTLVVTCLKCQRMTAWSHTVATQKQRDGTSRIDEGKWRWVCPTERLEPKGCGGRFYDTSKTPFSGSRVPPGFVFAALAYPSGVIQDLLKKGQRLTDLEGLSNVLADLKKKRHQEFRGRLMQYARLFCGTVLLRDCPNLTRSFKGVQDIETRLRSLHGAGPIAKEYDAAAVNQRQKSYDTLRNLVNTMQGLDTHSPRGQEHEIQAHRKQQWQELQLAVQRLRDPIHTPPMDLQALLAEASLPSPC